MRSNTTLQKLPPSIVSHFAHSVSFDSPKRDIMHSQSKVLVNGYATCGPGFRTASELWSGLLTQRNFACEEMDRKNQFDNHYFLTSLDQAPLTDPQIRLLLELTHEALTEAGVEDFSNLPRRDIGVYVGSSFSDFQQAALADENFLKFDHVGTAGSMLANRISQYFHFGGPSMKIDSACSSSLQALDVACNDIRSGKVAMAIVGGANLILDPKVTAVFQRMRMVSTASRPLCKTFSDFADGYVRKEAVCVLVLSSDDAVREYGLESVAEVLGHFSLSGSSGGITAPSVETQELLYHKVSEMTSSLGYHNLPPVRYVECHGSGTKRGDEAEILSLTNVVRHNGTCAEDYNVGFYMNDSTTAASLLIGSVKSNIGHAEAASGLMGVIKVLLSLESGNIPSNLHFSSDHRNSLCHGLDNVLAVVSKLEPIEKDAVAVINSFGFGGTYVQVMVRGIPSLRTERGDVGCCKGSHHGTVENEPWKNINAVLGRTEESTRKISSSLLKLNISFSGLIGPPSILKDGFQVRAFTTPVEKTIYVRDGNASSVVRPVWVVFTGSGANWPGMGFELYQQSAIYKDTYDVCNSYLSGKWDCCSLQRLLDHQQAGLSSCGRTDGAEIDNPFVDIIDATVCLTSLQICLINVLEAAHFNRAACGGYIGYSTGEIAAGYFDGSLSLERTLDIAFLRGQAAANVANRNPGAMLAVTGLSKDEMECILSGVFSNDLTIACHTGPKQVTLSGSKSKVAAVELELKDRCPACHFSRVNTFNVAFHSNLIDDDVMGTLRKNLEAVFEKCEPPTRRSDKWISSFCNKFNPNGYLACSDYYCIGFKTCVEFERACNHIPEGAIVVECGPCGLFRSVFTADRTDGKVVQYMSLLSRNKNAVETLSTVYGNLHLERVLLSDPCIRVSPKTAFPEPTQRSIREAFLEWDHSNNFSTYQQQRRLTSGVAALTAYEQKYDMSVVFDLTGEDMWLREHRVDSQCLMPAAVYLYIIWKHMRLERNEQCVLKNFKIHCPLDISTLTKLRFDIEILPPLDLETSRGPASSGGREVQVSCCTNPQVSGSSKVVATCMVEIKHSPPPQSSFVKISGGIDIQSLYHRLGRHAYDYGEDFRVISAMSSDRCKAELLVSVHDAVEAVRKSLILILEGMLQVAVVHKLSNSQYGLCQLPVLIDEVTLCHPCRCPPTASSIGVTVQPGASVAADNFVRIGGVHLQKRLSSSAAGGGTQTDNVSKVELVDVRADGADNADNAGNDGDDIIDVIHLKINEGKSCFDQWSSAVRGLRVGPTMVLLISETCGFSGFIRSLRKEPAYAHVRGLQIQQAGDAQRVEFVSLLKKAQQVFAKRSELSCLFVGVGVNDESMLSLLEERISCPTRIVYPSPHGCFLTLSTAKQLGEKKPYCWQPINRTKNSSSSGASNVASCNVEVEYASLNFRDVMISSGQLNRSQAISRGGYSYSGGGFGLDFAGYRESTSEQSSHQSDDKDLPHQVKVIGLGRDCIASHLYSQPLYLSWNLPDNADLEAYATVPCAYATAYYALCVRGRLCAKDKVLVHCGAGGVGQAALYICKNRLLDLSSQLYVTCGNPQKRKYISDCFGIPMNNIGDSRSPSFLAMVEKQTGGTGVNLVLNSLTGVLMEASVESLTFCGVLLELGKTDIEPNVMRKLRRNDRQLVMIDLDQIMAHPSAFEPVHELIAKGLHSGEVQPLLFEAVHSMPSEIDDAFTNMLSSSRIGKVLLKMERGFMQATVPCNEGTFSRASSAKKQVIIIVGGLGGLGLCLAQCLALEFGRVCNLVLCGCSGVDSLERRHAVEYMRHTLGTAVDIHVGDFSTRNLVDNLMMSFLQGNNGVEPSQICGFFNAAAITQDVLFDEMSSEQWVRPFPAKCAVTENFSHAFSDPRFARITSTLRYFVCFSSIVVGVGNPGQTNYACANASMEAIVKRRVEKQLPGLCIRLGIIPHTGLAMSIPTAADHAALCPISLSNAMDQIRAYTLSEQSGICTVYGKASTTCLIDALTHHDSKGHQTDNVVFGCVLNLIRKHAQDGVVHEDIVIGKHSFDSLGMYVLFDDLQKQVGCQEMSMKELFELTPKEVALRCASNHFIQPTTVMRTVSHCGENGKERGCPVVVIATIGCGSESLSKVTVASALASVRDQSHEPDVTFVVFEQYSAEKATVLSEDEIAAILPSAKVIYNKRTEETMAGAVNTGIMQAFIESEVGDNFWIAFLDTTMYKWESTHLEGCVRVAGSVGTTCGWVIASLETEAGAKSDDVNFFLQPDPKSSWLVRCSLLMEAGMFDEALTFSMDFDLSIRLCDVMPVCHCREVTGALTVLLTTSTDVEKQRRADFSLFLYKHHARMTTKQLTYVFDGFGCDNNDADVRIQQNIDSQEIRHEHHSVSLAMWNSDDDRKIFIRRDTSELLSFGGPTNDDKLKPHRKMLVGITTGNIRRISGLLGDLGCLLDNDKHCVVIFANNNEDGFDRKVSTLLHAYPFRGHVIRTTDHIIQELYPHHDIPLPIAKSRTALQTFLYATTKVELFDAVAVLDDDSRLPKGWGIRDGDEDVGDILLGRAIKTPPNPTAMSMRTQLLDFLYALDLQYATTHSAKDGVTSTFTYPWMDEFRDMHDQYYDLSSSRWDHLELPRLLTDYGDHFSANNDNFVELCRRRILVGDPLAREAVSLEDGESCQRGGCMVVFRKQFHLLGYEQVAPTVVLASGRRVSSRRSDSFWVMNHHNVRGKKAVVRPHLSFLHDNMYDSIPSPERIRESVALEMIGAILCRPRETRQFAFQRMFSLQCSISRIRGICKALRGRWFFSKVNGLASFVDYLEALFDEDMWRRDVFDIIDKNAKALETWRVSDENVRETLKSYALNENEFNFLKPKYPDACEIGKGPLMPIPCLHRIHSNDTEILKGAQYVQRKIGMSLPLPEMENRLRQLSQLARVVGLYRDSQHESFSCKALVTIDDGFKDVMLLQPIFQELSDNLQPVLCIPSAILRDGNEGMSRKHLPLTCLYDYCHAHGIEPDDEIVLGDVTRSVLKTLPEQEQYKRLRQAGIPTDISTHDLLTLQDIRSLSHQGWWVCSHGPDHSDLSNSSSFESVLRELKLDIDFIVKEGWAPWFAWPEGCWDTRVSNAVEQHTGATAQFGLSSCLVGKAHHPSVVNRVAWLGDNQRHRVLVTGSSGFLGRHLLLVLQGYGCDVFPYDITDGKDIRCEESLLSEFRRNRITCCVHLAAIADLNEAEKNPAFTNSVNVDGTRVVLSCCNEVGVRLLFASTCCVYGNNGVAGASDESSPVAPPELYARTKLVSEEHILHSGSTLGLNHVVMRLATFYGPNMRPSLATSLFLKAAEQHEPILIHGDGNQTRCFTHVHDIAEGIRVVLQTTGFSGIVNISDDRECSVNELAHICMQVVRNVVDIHHVTDRCSQIKRSKIDNSHLRALGWKPTVSLEAGMMGCRTQSISNDVEETPPHTVHELSRNIVARCKLEQTLMPLRPEKCTGVMHVTELLPDGTQLIAYVVGDVRCSVEVHVRIHSECLTGDILGSLKCDCGPQKQAFLDFIGEGRPGVFLYVKGHEGRGAGLVMKTRAYHDLDQNSKKHHNDALLDAGAEKTDARCYLASAELILRLIYSGDRGDCEHNSNYSRRSKEEKVNIIVHTNNEEKIEAVHRTIATSVPYSKHFTCQQRVIPAGEHCNPLNQKYLLEKQRDNGQRGLSVMCASAASASITPETIDELPEVTTKVNEVKFDANDSRMFEFLREFGYVVVNGLVSSEQVIRAKRSYEAVHCKLCVSVSQLCGNVSSKDCSNSISQMRDLFLREDEECNVFRELTEDGTSPTNMGAVARQAMAALDPEGEWTGIKLLHDHIISKPAGLLVSKRIPLHQDRMFWPTDIPACSTWTPLNDVPLNGGCMELMTLASKPHLHRQCVHAVDFMADELTSGLKLVLSEDSHPVRWLVPMNAGDTLVFSSHAWHRSSPNYQLDSNRMAYIQTWVHPLARWRPDLVPWHPVNEHLRKEGGHANSIMSGKRHPTVGIHPNATALFPSCDDKLIQPRSCYYRTECVNVATKQLGSQISMFDAGDVISTQLRNICSHKTSYFSDQQPRKLKPLVNLIKDSSLHNQILELTLQLLRHRKESEKLLNLYKESGCTTIRELVTWTLKEIMISAAAYECDRSRNVFNSAYSAWWTVAGEAWNDYFLTSKFSSNFELCKTDVSTFLERICVDPAMYTGKLDLLSAVIRGCMSHIPFQNFTMLTRVHSSYDGHSPKESYYRSPPTLGDIIGDMLTGIGGLCSVRNPFLYLLLRALDFEHVRFVSGTMCFNAHAELVDAHVALLVSVERQEYWVDIANGWPYVKPIPVDGVGDNAMIKHPFSDTRLITATKKGKSVICVQHRQWPDEDWKDNYYFEREPTKKDYHNVFIASMQKHYDCRENYGPFLFGLRFNMWNDEEGVLLRDNNCWVLNSGSAPQSHKENYWDATKFKNLLQTSSFAAVDSLAKLIPEAWKMCQGNAATEAEKITVTGGFFDETANAYIGMITVWRSQKCNAVVKLTFEVIREYTPDIFPVINKGFAGGSWYNSELYVCWPNRVSVLSPSMGWVIRMNIDHPGFNDLHHVHACDHGIWVANTGCDTVDEVDINGKVTARYPLSNDSLSVEGVVEDLRDQKSHTARRGCHNEHVNYVSPLQCDASSGSTHDLTATLLQSKRVVSIGKLKGERSTPMAVNLEPSNPPHEGFIATVPCVSDKPLLWNSTVDGHVIASDPKTGDTVKRWEISRFGHLPRGWTRGLVLLHDGFLVGCTVIHGDAARWIAQHNNKWDFDIDNSKTAVSFIPFEVTNTNASKFVSFLSDRKGKIFSLLRTPSSIS